ncbi:galactose oxidase/kelch repeat superfamily protein [Striga asiatica]|uniref:Galactose oxidase/kelch repeat superfamily protein n=1 Tax=Striga asiatica TaxID=4170 RepID=A0A5A7NZW3_STRAF|nr:galactose oxidase/kelch repeat superfamily protein [Striga asiatica]
MQRVRISSHQSPVHKLGDSQMTLSPKFKLGPTRDPSLPDPTLEETHDPLIPGLPDDVALQCLLRVPVDQHPSCRPVSRRWFSLFGRKERFFTLRKELGFHDPWLFVFAYHKCTAKIEWKVLDLIRLSWHSIPSMPCKDKVCPQGFRCVSTPKDGALYVFGGVVSDVDCPLNLVLKYEARKNKWTVMKKMITARSFFASGVIDGMIYVAGGNSTDLFELNSAEVFNPVNGLWRPVSNMRSNMSSYDSAVLDGKLLVTEGWFWPFYVVPRGQVYDPITDSWGSMAIGLREGWTGSSVVIDGRLFVVTEHERTKVKVYDSGSDSWESVDGPVLPEEICKPFKVGSWGWEIYVVGRNLHVAVGRVERAGSKGFRVEWRVVDAPGSLFDLTPASAQVLFA